MTEDSEPGAPGTTQDEKVDGAIPPELLSPEDRVSAAMRDVKEIFRRYDCSQILELVVPSKAVRTEDGGFVISPADYELRVVPNPEGGQ